MSQDEITKWSFSSFAAFVLHTRHEDLPVEVAQRSADLVLDLIGVSAAANGITAARIGRETAVRLFGAGSDAVAARILFDGRVVSRSGAAFAGATQIDSLDAHDGFSAAKGHAGCGLFPAALAFAELREDMSCAEFLTSMVVGYEIACRAGLALHGSVKDYHTSGAWVSLAAAALGVRLNNGDPQMLRHAIGIAEYHGPRSQMMREIDNPSMLHDGSGWGSMTGVCAAEMALAGFEGAPAVTVEDGGVADIWADLGSQWLTLNQNIKLFPVCRWAHAPIQAVLNLRSEYGIKVDEVDGIEIYSFREATRLARDIPQTTGKAQYSISYPVAAALLYGQLGQREVSGETFDDKRIASLVKATVVSECDICNDSFPQDRLGRVVVTTKDGRRLDSQIVRAPGEHTNPIERSGIVEKYRAYAHPGIGQDRAYRIEQILLANNLSDIPLSNLTDLLYPPV